MQPVPSVVPTTSSHTRATSSSPSPSRQHGVQELVQRLSPAPRRGSDDHRYLEATDSGDQTPDVTDSTPSQDIFDLNTFAASSSVNRNRIAEYESTPKPHLKKRSLGPSFDVIKKSRALDDNACPIADLPNEVLTHAFANLSPTDLSSVLLVSKRFHEIVTTQHAWRSAFSRYFAGPEALRSPFWEDEDDDEQDTPMNSKREFARLTALASWRSEYILRTRLLRSLARGKPVQPTGPPIATRSAQSHTAAPTVVYNTQMLTTVNHLQASFGTGLNKTIPHFVHGADAVGNATSSDPTSRRTLGWGLVEPSTFSHFVERHSGALYGLGSGELVGIPNTLDVSETYGMVYAEGLPGGMVYFHYLEELSGRFLAVSSGISMPELGIPKIPATRESQTSVWLAKSATIPTLTDGMIGLFAGSSLGVLTAYSAGLPTAKQQKRPRGEMTARWVLCPGIPIIAIQVDEDYSFSRQGQNRIWAAVLNALGEVFYITKFPKRASSKHAARRVDDEVLEEQAWLSGRSVFWALIESTRRTSRPDPYGASIIDGSYTPRSSWAGMCLSPEQIKAESREIEAFLTKRPVDVQAVCTGWDMRRKLEVDFAGDDGHDAGESVVVIETGLDEDTVPAVSRYTRVRSHGATDYDGTVTPSLTEASTAASTQSSLFGGTASTGDSFDDMTGRAGELRPDLMPTSGATAPSEEWRTTILSFDGLRSFQITFSTMDQSIFARTTAQEDPLLNFSNGSVTSSPSLTPMSATGTSFTPSDIPGYRTRLLALGTSMGTVILYNIRSHIPPSTLTNSLSPLRIIHTSSPSISTLALSSLYLVHGGTDGLVQAWDPLASSISPIRTLHSRFSSRARRRLAQAAASPAGVGINLFAAGAVVLDPDPTVLRGAVSLGTHLFYWHFSASAADAYRSHKRRMRRSERLSNGGAAADKFAPASRGGAGGAGGSGTRRFIENEKWELEREEVLERREQERRGRRFGTDLLGEDASEEEMVAYAALLSQEAFEEQQQQQQQQRSKFGSVDGEAHREKAEEAPGGAHAHANDDDDRDLVEAIRLSLALDNAGRQEEAGPWGQEVMQDEDEEDHFGVPVRYAKQKRRTPKDSPRFGAVVAGASDAAREKDELAFALEISMAEEQSRREALNGGSAVQPDWEADVEAVVDEFPGLPPVDGGGRRGNGKGKERAF